MLVTDKLRSYGAAKFEIRLSARHEQGLHKNDRAENSRGLTRRRERGCSASDHPDQPSASCPFTPLSKTPSTSSAISPPGARSGSSEKKHSRRGKPRPRREPILGLPIPSGPIQFS